MSERETFDTTALLRRERLPFGSAQLLAWLEGATHELIGHDQVIFYRHIGGDRQVALARESEPDVWTVSPWQPSRGYLPLTLRPLHRPDVRTSALTRPLI